MQAAQNVPTSLKKKTKFTNYCHFFRRGVIKVAEQKLRIIRIRKTNTKRKLIEEQFLEKNY